MMFQSKILRTKKKSSDERMAWSAVYLGFFSLFVVLTYGLRLVLVPGVFGAIPVEIPVVINTIKDIGRFGYKEESRHEISRTTPTVVVTTESFYFGELASFTENYADFKDKFVVRHLDGEPQLGQLKLCLEHWIKDRSKKNNLPIDKILVVIPASDIPMPILIQIIAELRKLSVVGRVVLGGGLI